MNVNKLLHRMIPIWHFQATLFSLAFPPVLENFNTVRHLKIDKYQSGFRSSYSITTALLNLTDNILAASDKQNVSVLVDLDFSKAIDTIDELLGAKLSYCFDLLSLAFSHSYLNSRTQKVRLGNNVSQSIAVCSGVPQGSILDPLLFLVYTADMFKYVKHCHIQAYADCFQL